MTTLKLWAIWTGLMVLLYVVQVAQIEEGMEAYALLLPMLGWFVGSMVLSVVGLARQDSRDAAAANAQVIEAVTRSAGVGAQTQISAYRAKTEDAAGILFHADAARMAAAGYHPVSQIWAPGRRGRAPYLMGLFLSLWFIGIPILIYLLAVKPDGTLTVAYELRRPSQASASAPDARPIR